MKLSVLKAEVFPILVMMFISAFLAGSVYAQSGTTGISGTVTDQNGAGVPGATVRVINPETGFNRSVTTNDEGQYNFPSISPATYRIEVEASNFKKTIKSDIRALVDSPINVDIPLQAGDVSAVVDVTADNIESVINTQDASLGNNFVPQQITELPSNLRRVTDLMTLQPGVTREGYVAGGRSDQANVTLDGVDINDQQTGGRTSQFQTTQNTVLRVTTEAVEEFRITTTNPNANQGRSSGAQISLVTKSGTNNLRGSAFYFYRPTAFSANDFFNNLAGIERPSLARKVFGGSIGGPIVKDKFFFFYAYEGQRERQDASVVRLVPLAHVGQGQLRFFGAAPGDPAGTNRLITLSTAQLNTIFPQAGINPAAVAVLADAARRYPANDTSIGDGVNTGGFRFNAPTTDNENTHIARFDYNINERQSLFFRGNYQEDLEQQTSYFPDTPSPTLWEHPYGFVAGHNWTISNNMINNFRYGFTRQAFTQGGDTNGNEISFRFVFQPLFFQNTLSRITPTHNITDDFTWIKGNHTIQMGGNVRIIRNQRQDYVNAFDNAVTNPSFYEQSGAVINTAFAGAGYRIGAGQSSIVQSTTTALIGRFSQYSGNFTFDLDGSVLPAGTPTDRNFATEEYDIYGQDIWKPYRNLTLTLGLRYGLSRPVYEKNGYQIVPDQRLGDVFDRRVASALTGVPNNEIINFTYGGPFHKKPGFYSMDWNNLQPSIAFAWSPSFKDGFLRTLFGGEDRSTIRGGFRIVNDYFGQQLAVSFSNLSSIGFTSSNTIAANTYNVTTNLAPRFTGFGQDVRSLPGIPAPTQRFSTPADQAQRIETSLDATIKSPTHYTWNVSYGRQLPKGMYFEASYVGRAARNLFATRDVMALNNLVDPASGMDWYTAAGILHDLRAANTPINQVPVIPYFQNLFPNYTSTVGGVALNSTQRIYRLVARENLPGPVGGGLNILDWTFVQLLIDDRGIYPNMFFHPQYAAFSAYGTVAKSNYNGAVFSLRQRLGETLSYDINYTFSKSMDDASGLQTGTSYGSQFILNPLRQEDNYAPSDFDARHVVNANFILQIPFGRNRAFFSGMNKVVDALLGGWQLSGVYRFNTGLPISSPFDAEQWATNWNAQSNGTQIAPIEVGAVRSTQNLFADPQAAFNAFRNARPGETGERNNFRLPGYQTLDLGLSKSFQMPWSENHKLQVRWEVFNVQNFQYFNGDNATRSSYGLPIDPELGTASPDFGKIFTSIQGSPRSMQFGLRYSF
ncbi:MAG: carboxypeptidase-like regulatory domain-containing protein [Acidobacteria bacterium]|nr:carboxypeptidase-like regulatory domain-containing protein [Acidobacteriota bacterium]MCA1638719.1 carboxypeptidase-like regulatory domain-containing protein [Acidobacteriota bacterium]